MKKFVNVFLVLAFLLFTSCENNVTVESSEIVEEMSEIEIVETEIEDENVNIDSNNLAETGMKINSVNKKILSELEKQIEGNIVYSNTGIQTILSMINYAADGNTKEEILAVNGNFNKNLNSNAVNIYNFLVSNQINNNINIKENFINTLQNEEYLKSDIYTITNENNPSMVTKAVNDKIFNETNGQIENGVDERTYQDSNFIMQLGNVIHFYGKWAKNSEPYELRNYYFTNKNNEKVVSDFVVLNENDGSLIENEDIIGLTLDYEEDNLRYKFVVFIPKNENDFNVNEIDVENLNYYNDLKYKLNASFPKFEFDNEIELISILKTLGINDLFDPNNANLSNGFDIENQNVYVSNCNQKSVIRVDEVGTEASALTTMGIRTMSMPNNALENVRYVDIVFNRPFYFLIYDSIEEIPLFVGEINTLLDNGKEVEDAYKDVETINDRIIEE